PRERPPPREQAGSRGVSFHPTPSCALHGHEYRDRPLRDGMERFWKAFGSAAARTPTGQDVRMQVLIVEDERRFAHLLARRLEDAGYATSLAFTGEQGLDRATRDGPDLAVVDVMLPQMDGVTMTRTLRERGSDLPVLMLTARDALEDRVKGLASGADDYLVKPFAFQELLARIEALTRRTGRSPRLSAGPVELDVAAHRVTVDGRPV